MMEMTEKKPENSKLEAFKAGLEALIQKMQDLIATGEYSSDEEMGKKDVSDIMSEVKDDMSPESTEDMSKESTDPLHEEMRNFMKSKNLGSRPKGLKAVVMKAQVKPMSDMPMMKKYGKK